MSTETSHPETIPLHTTAAPPSQQIIIYGHSRMLYWWPVWVVGYVMALLTWLHPVQVQIGSTSNFFSPGNNMGVLYCVLLLLVVLFTSTNLRGMLSTVVVLCIAFIVLLFAHLKWWDSILNWFGDQSVHLNLGFYLFFSTALLVFWVLVVFIFDHLSFWRVRPGQLTHETLLGMVDQSFDTDNMIFGKSQADLFRHWILGLGSGDLTIKTLGGRGVELNVPNVLFAGAKVIQIERLIATKPDVAEQA
jgi:hypothetical protein